MRAPFRDVGGRGGPLLARLARVACFACLVALAVLGAPGCGPGPSADQGPVAIPATPATLAVDLGTGTDAFAALADGGAVSVVTGPQGGHHIWVAVRVHDTTVTDVKMNLTATEEDGFGAGEVATVAVTLLPDGDARTITGERLFVDSFHLDAGQRLVLHADVVATDGRHGSARRLVVVK
jgi:hypothetical protein